jgi:hypothetical protein
MQHYDLLKLLIACQLAVIEHSDEHFGTDDAKPALIKRLNEALKLAKKLRD